MPTLPVIPNAVKVAVHWPASLGAPIITFGVSSTAPTLSAVADIIVANVTAGMWGSIPNNVIAESISLFRYDGVTPSYSRTVTGANWTGGVAASEVTIALAMLLSLVTTTRGPHARGRIYLPLTAEGAQNGGVVSGTIVTSVGNAWSTFRTALATANAPMQVISLAENETANPPRHPGMFPVQSIIARSNLGTQRRRQDRVAGR